MESVDNLGSQSMGKLPVDNEPVLSAHLDVELTKLDPALDKRYVDRAFHSMIEDAVSGESEKIWPINKRLFRETEDVPLVDDIQIDGAYVTRLLGNKA